MLEGVLAAHPRSTAAVPGSPRSIIAKTGPRPGKVGIVIGGGSGHEPTFLGFVGKGLADACAVGNVFASPPPDPILECAKAVSGGAGVLFQYGNYAGDVMNFDMAAEMAAMDDIEVRTVLTTDDVATRDKGKRRGVAGNFFVFKAGGAAARQDAAARRGRTHRAQGQRPDVHHGRRPVALLAAADAQAEFRDRPRRDGDRHGHPWRTGRSARASSKTADEIVDDMLDRIFAEMALSRGDKVAVLVNSLGSTPPMELYIMNRRVKQRLDAAGARHPRHMGRQLLHVAGDGRRLGDLASP